MSQTTLSRLTLLRQQADARLRRERQWMEEHGSTLTSYVVRYGSARDPEHYGDGGEAIYAADQAVLDRAQDAANAANADLISAILAASKAGA